MRKFLLALPLSLLAAQLSFGAACDTTFTIENGSPGYDNNGTYTPNAANAINSVFAACTDTAMTIRIAFSDPGRGDTLKLANEIILDNRSGKTTRIIGVGTSNGIVTFTEANVLTTTPILFRTAGTSIAQLSNFGFARKSNISTANYSVVLNVKGSTISGCHFGMLDNMGTARAAMVDVEADSVLIERSMFRTAQDGTGQALAIRTGGTASKVEIRANVFVGTGVLLQATGSVHLFANSFVGTRSVYNFVTCENTISNPETAVNIQHNLFAAKTDSLSPIFFNSNVGQLDSIRGNAWARAATTVSLVNKVGNTAGDISLATGTAVNTPLPRGFSNYASSVPVKDYPLTGLRTDPALAASNADFGKIFNVFTTSTWTTIADIATALPSTSGKLYFPGFAPFVAGQTWNAGYKVGAFVAQDNLSPINPLETGAQGASLTFVKDPASSTKIKMTSLKLDTNYYKAKFVPTNVFFAFDTLANFANFASNDSATIRTTTGANTISKTYASFLADSLLTVPVGLRNGGNLYVKMLHYRTATQANFPSTAGIATVTGVPGYPFNDLVLAINTAASDFPKGNVTLTMSRGAEVIDSIKVAAYDVANNVLSSSTKPAATTSFSFALSFKGNVHFKAQPMVKITGGVKLGSFTADVGPVALHSVTGDTLYVKRTGDTCTSGDGSLQTPYCTLDSALINLQVNNNGTGGVIIISNNTPPFAFEDVNINAKNVADSGSLTLISTNTAGKFDDNRPIFRGKNGPALTIKRKNVTIKGLVFEMPAGSTGKAAISVDSSGAIIEANIFRTANKTAGVEGPAVGVNAGATQLMMSNNVVWGFTKGVTVTNSASTGIKILHNTFMDDKLVPNTGKTIGISVVGASLNAVIANNFFSNITSPLDVSVAGKTPTLDHNVYTVSKPALQGIVDIGGLDSNMAIRSTDLTASSYIADLNASLNDAFSCSSVQPCPSLQAGSSTVDYKVTVLKDVFGNTRSAKKDVGAYEVNPVTGTVLGRLSVKATKATTAFSKVYFTIATKNFDPAESDSVHVWWTTSASGTLDTSVSASRQKHFPMSKLATGTLTDSITGLAENTAYHIFAAYGKFNSAKPGVIKRDLSYVYSDTVTTSVNIEVGDCTFSASDKVCPSQNGFFINTPTAGIPTFRTTVTFAKSVAPNSSIKNPTFTKLPSTNVFNLDLISTLPQISLNIKEDGLGTVGSAQVFSASIEMDTLPILGDNQLFLLPVDSTSLPSLVSTWTLIPLAGGKATLKIEGTKGGILNYAFGKLAPAAEPGKIEFANTTVQTFNYADTVNHLTFAIRGSGFKTSNPLVVVSVAPAGGTISGGPFSGSYPVNSLALTANLADLEDGLRQDGFYKYYLKAAGVDGKTGPLGKMVKPFGLDTVSAGNFNASVLSKNANLKLSGSGALEQTSVNIPIDISKYKAAELGRKASRSFEIIFTVFDGSKISRGHGFIRSQFTNAELQQDEKSEKKPNTWNLYGYPWDESSQGNLVRVLSQTAKKWNPEQMRAMKYKGSGTGAGSFITYTGESATEARFDSGQAIWTGAVAPYTPASESGTSLDYQTFSLNLPAGQWSDISLPFNFPIRLQDILDSTGLTSETIPPWFIFNDQDKKWTRVTATSVLFPWIGMSVKPVSELTIKFPVLDTTRTLAAAAKVAANDAWTVDLRASNITASMDLQVGSGARQMLFSEPPSVPGQNFRVGLKHLNNEGKVEVLSQYVQGGSGALQGHWPLSVSASSGSQGLDLRVVSNAKSAPLYLVESLSKKVLTLGNNPIHLTEVELKTNDYHLVAGDANYLQNILADLSPDHLLTLSNYPNPFANSTSIRYSLPISFGKVGYSLKIRDFLGRTVFEKAVNQIGSFNFVWNGKDTKNKLLPTGVYTLFLDAKVEGKATYYANRRIMKL